MKKIISFVLAAAMSAMVAVPAFAVDAETKKDGEANTWTTSGQNEAYADKMMTMVAYAPGEGGSITVDSIQYIDQTTADSTGAYSFSSYIPKSLPTEQDYSVKVGGETLATAIDAGVIQKIEKVDVPITGTITTQSNAANATISFCQAGSTDPVVSVDTVNGAFTANVAPGTYDVIISRVGYLKYKVTNVEISDSFQLGTFKLEAGDVDGNGAVTASDIGAVVLSIAKTSSDEGYSEAIDFDANGSITASDIGAVVLNIAHTDTTVDFADLQ